MSERNDRVLNSIETLIESIEGKNTEDLTSEISTREDIINIHYTFLKTMLLYPEKKV